MYISILNKPYILFFVYFFHMFFIFQLYEINILNYMNNGENILEVKVDYHLTSGEKGNYYFDGHESLNDFIQVDDN